jgi:rRNA maturation endonuclease Nob1
MGLFNKLGRKAEQFKQQAQAASEGEASHRCTACDSLLYTESDTCPECGADAVVARDEE